MTCCVLVIEDDTAICTLLKAILEDEGYSVVLAHGAGALACAQELRPAVILLDLMMPGLNGYELGRRLRASAATATIPLVVMSASSQLRAGATSLGAAGYLPKPFDLEALVATVSTYAPLP